MASINEFQKHSIIERKTDFAFHCDVVVNHHVSPTRLIFKMVLYQGEDATERRTVIKLDEAEVRSLQKQIEEALEELSL